MREIYPEEYDFSPKTWIIPEQYKDFLKERKLSTRENERMYIVKPENGSQGRGIFLTRTEKDERIRQAQWSFGNMLVAQKYIQNPLLVSGYKFDIRLYVLIASCDPLRVYIYHDGLARLCTESFQPANDENKDNHFMHLTNYSINRAHTSNFQSSHDATEGSVGSKRTLSALLDTMRREGRPLDDLWPRLRDMAAKAAIAAQPALARHHRTYRPADMAGDCCFELLGMDVLLDDALRPWLLEMNLAPSLQVCPPASSPALLPPPVPAAAAPRQRDSAR